MTGIIIKTWQVINQKQQVKIKKIEQLYVDHKKVDQKKGGSRKSRSRKG